MPSIHESRSFSVQAVAASVEFPSRNDERIYQAATIVAMLLVLGSLWIF